MSLLTDDQLAARTPAEAKRHEMIDRLWLHHLFSCALLLGIVGIIWLGRWPVTLDPQRLGWLGIVASGALLMQMLVVFTLSLGGPVGRWRARWRDGSVGADDDEAAARNAYDGGPSASGEGATS